MSVKIKEFDSEGNRRNYKYRHLCKLDLQILETYKGVKRSILVNRWDHVTNRIEDPETEYCKVSVLGHKRFTVNGCRYKTDELKGFTFKIKKNRLEIENNLLETIYS